MNKKLKQDYKKYVKSIKTRVICKYSLKKMFLIDLKSRISDFMALNPDATILDIENQFGSAEEIANSFKDIITEQIMKKAKLYKILMIISIVILIILAIFIYELLRGYGGTYTITDPY